MADELLTGQEPVDGQDQDQMDEAGLSDEALDAELKRARRDAARYRTELRKLQEAEEERQRGQMSELERLQADLAAMKAKAEEAEAARQAAVVRGQVLRAATQANMHDPDDAARYLDTLEVGEDGQVVGLAEAIQALAKSKPHLFKSDKAPRIGATAPDGGQQGPTDEQLRAELFGGRRSNIFGGPGGGVFWGGKPE